MRVMGASPWQAVIGAGCVAMMNGESRWGAGAAGSFHVGLYTQTWALSAFPLALGYGARWITKGDKLAPAVAWGAFCGLCHPFAVVALGLAYVVTVAFQFVLAPLDYLFRYLGDLIEPIAPDQPPADFHLRVLHVVAQRWKSLPCEGRFMAPAPAHPRFTWLPGPLGEAVRWLARFEQVWRLVVLGLLMLVAFMPIWLPLLVDYDGFGGFPHRVNDEVGPGFKALADWHFGGKILDFIPQGLPRRVPILTYMLIPVVLFARGPFMRWLLTPALVYALLLGLGPNLGTTQDDLFPMVRFLGAMQTVMALAIGAGVVGVGMWIWDNVEGQVAYVVRTILAAAAVALALMVAIPGSRALGSLVHVMPEWDNQHRDELMEISEFLAHQPQGRKQVSTGAENHWWNLLTYVYGRTPSLLQMGGGGLQASPNYDYLWNMITQWREFTKAAWLYDAPYLVYQKSSADKMPPGDVILTTSVDKVVFDDPNPLWPKMHVTRAAGNYEVRKLPTAGLVSPIQITAVLPPGNRKGQPGREAALKWAHGEGPTADQFSVYAGYGVVGDVPDGQAIKSWRQMSPGDDADIVATLDVRKPTTFVIRESWHPRWHAYVDGDEVPVLRVTPDFPAVNVPPGHHELALRFERPWWAWASWLAWPGAALGAWLLTRRLARARLPVARVVS
jgi:hypothetical protein